VDFRPDKGDVLTGDQSPCSVEIIGWLADIRPQVELPIIEPEWFYDVWGDAGRSKRIKTWGHEDGKLSAHVIAVRGGTGCHTDPGFARYSVHIELFNGGWYTHGLDQTPDNLPLFQPGLVSVLDTYSPHMVEKDPRLPLTSPSKLALAIDTWEYPELDPAIDALVAFLPHIAVPIAA